MLKLLWLPFWCDNFIARIIHLLANWIKEARRRNFHIFAIREQILMCPETNEKFLLWKWLQFEEPDFLNWFKCMWSSFTFFWQIFNENFGGNLKWGRIGGYSSWGVLEIPFCWQDFSQILLLQPTTCLVNAV